MSSPPLSKFDLRKKISPKQARRSRTRSRTPSYSPPPPPSHPSRMKSKSRKKVEEAISRNSKNKASSEMRRPRSRSRSRTKRDRSRSRSRRARSGSRERREKGKKKRRSSSDSSSTEEDLLEQRKKIKKLLKEYKEVDKAMVKSASKVLDSTRSRSKRKSGSGESRRSREEEADRLHRQMMSNKTKPLRVSTDPDQVVPSPQISPPAPPLVSPSVARTTFKPKQVNGELAFQVKDHKMCKVCSSYFRDTEEDARLHLSQHPDRVFLVSLPSDIYFYTIEEAIIHLITKVGIKKEDIEEKVRKNILIKNPTNLRGFSCDICEVLDTSKEAELSRHIRDDCKVTEKTERAKHVIFFCRGCQVLTV